DLAHHTHLQVFGWSDMAMPEVSARIGCQVVISEAAAYVDGDRSVWHAVVEARRIGISVKVHCVLLKQVRPHDHADVAQGEEEFVVFIQGHERGRDVAVHYAHIHDLPRVDMSRIALRRWRGTGTKVRPRTDGDRWRISVACAGVGHIDRSHDTVC